LKRGWMRFWVSSSVVAVAVCAVSLAQTPKAEPKKAAANGRSSGDAQTEWLDPCRDVSLSIEVDKNKRIQIIRTASWPESSADCSKMPPGRWKTGLGLRVDDPTVKIVQLYGEPDSKSPSSKGEQQLELWYYAFDWAGPDVPQVMEVLCTVEQNGKPGRVVEITLAAPSL
jgi:hypothetical protein